MEIAEHVANGLSYKEIAVELRPQLKPVTVAHYVKLMASSIELTEMDADDVMAPRERVSTWVRYQRWEQRRKEA